MRPALFLRQPAHKAVPGGADDICVCLVKSQRGDLPGRVLIAGVWIWDLHFFLVPCGNQWCDVPSVHDDPVHKHAHILLNNQGLANGTWF